MNRIFLPLLGLIVSASASFAQNVTVSGSTGANATYATLKAAFDALNVNTNQTGNTITVSIIGNTTETASAVLNQPSGGSWSTLTISPSGTRSISGAIAGNLIDLNGADNVTISGAGTLTIENTSNTAAATTIRFINDAKNNTVQNCNIKGSGTGTAVGTIFFSTGTTAGNDGNVISSNNITSSGATFPINAIYSAGTSAAIDNSGITVSDNNLSDYFSATVASNGILVASNSSAWAITGNKFFQSGTRTATTANLHTAITIVTASGGGYTINNNTIGFANTGGTGSTVYAGAVATRYYGMDLTLAASPVSNVQGNTINGFSFSTTSGAVTAGSGIFQGITLRAGGANIGTTAGNTIGAISGTGAINITSTTSLGYIAGIYATSTGTVSIQNNNVGSLNTGGGAAIGYTFAGIQTAGAAGNFTISANTIGSTATANSIAIGLSGTTTAVTTFQGIVNGATGTISITGNTIQNCSSFTSAAGLWSGIVNTAGTGTLNITTNSILSGTLSGTGAFVAISNSASPTTANINTNTIRSHTGGGAVSAISSSGASTTISYNKISDLNGSNAASTVNGLLISAGTPVTVFNNLIGNLTAPAANTANAINGINLTSTQTSSSIKVYYNTVYLNNTSSGSGFGSSGIFHTISTTATTSALDLRNNIIVNTSTPTGAGLTVAYRRSAGAASNLANYAGTSNNNDFYAGTPGASRLIYSDGTGSAQTITQYKNGVFTAGTIAPRDSVSFSENPTFLSTSGSSANFLHMDPTVSTRIESGAAPIAGFTDDFDGDTRNVSTPDVGADEYAGAAPDLTPPVISYAALGNTSSFSSRTLTATITDATGVPTAGTGLPVLYWKINAGSYTAATATSLGSNQYQFTFGAGVAAGNTVSYYVVAQDSATTPNVSANPSTGASGFTFNPPAASTPPTTPNTYAITGSFNVGTGQTYTTLTAAVAALNSGPIGGPITLTLTDASYSAETLPITINANAGTSAVNTVTIKPATGVTPTISGSHATAIISLNGCDFVTIDGSNTVGGTSRDLTITNTNTAGGATLLFINDASNNTVKNTKIQGAETTATSGVVFFSTGTTTGNDGNTITNNAITSAGATLPANAIYSAGTSAAIDNSGITVSDNNLSDYFNATVASNGIQVASNSSAWAITGNKFFQSGTRTATTANLHTAITIVTASGGGYTINNNTIGFANAGGTGSTVYAGAVASRYYGMDLTLAASPVSNVQGNTINGFSFSTTSGAVTAGSGIFQGITLRAGGANIGTTAGNTIGAISGTGAINITSTTSLGYIAGIYATSTGTVSIQKQ